MGKMIYFYDKAKKVWYNKRKREYKVRFSYWASLIKEGIMHLISLDTKKQKKAFLKFHAQLYAGDKNYVCTENFALEDMLFAQTAFTRGCTVRPVAVVEGKRTLAQAMLIYSPRLPYVQMGFFDGLSGQDAAVELLLAAAKEMQKEVGAKGVVVGLNGHISYGVGILTEGFAYKNSFDSIYNKEYYKGYFHAGRAQGLSTFKTELQPAVERFPKLDARNIRIRKCDVKNFKKEMTLMGELCEKTIAKTQLYFPTDPLHFYELTAALQPFLTPEDLLFAENEKGETVGFLFSHPDFNQMLEGGREYSLLGIGYRFLFHKKKIDTVKINAIGSLSPRATCALLEAFAKQVEGKYQYVETTFIWDNNRKSAAIAERTLGAPHRKYEVYYYNEL